MKTKQIFNKNILQIEKNETFFLKHKKVIETMRIVKNNKKQFLIKKKKLQILKEKIDEYIKEHHDNSL